MTTRRWLDMGACRPHLDDPMRRRRVEFGTAGRWGQSRRMRPAMPQMRRVRREA